VRPFAGATLVTALAASACTAAADRQSPSEPPPVESSSSGTLEARLEEGERPAPAASGRNPFRFGASTAARPSRGGQAPLPPPDGLPELPLPIASPALTLIGVATLADGARVAMLRVGADLVLAREGETVAGRYLVKAVGDESVDLTDAIGERPLRLDLP
jgi:hypothetical protein